MSGSSSAPGRGEPLYVHAAAPRTVDSRALELQVDPRVDGMNHVQRPITYNTSTMWPSTPPQVEACQRPRSPARAFERCSRRRRRAGGVPVHRQRGREPSAAAGVRRGVIWAWVELLRLRLRASKSTAASFAINCKAVQSQAKLLEPCIRYLERKVPGLEKANARKGSHDVALVCRKGHILNDAMKLVPDKNPRFCEACGAEAIRECPACHHPIQGRWSLGRNASRGRGPSP